MAIGAKCARGFGLHNLRTKSASLNSKISVCLDITASYLALQKNCEEEMAIETQKGCFVFRFKHNYSTTCE